MNEQSTHQCGVYLVVNQRNGRFYVGSSRNSRERWRMHISELRCRKHANMAWQGDWNRFGPDAFQFKLLQSVTLTTKVKRGTKSVELIGIERMWLRYFSTRCPNLLYNIVLPDQSRNYPDMEPSELQAYRDRIYRARTATPGQEEQGQ